jgi:hypothetical protein
MSRRGVVWTWAAAASAAWLLGCEGCAPRPEVATSEPSPSSISVVDSGRKGTDERGGKGSGWYPNIEADDAGRLHLAWVDADAGDVRAAVTAPGGATLERGDDGRSFFVVDEEGAVGAFLRLALAPGGVPVFSYARQDTGIFRIAWRPADRPALAAAGAIVDDGPFPELVRASNKGSPIALSPGFVGEELGFGEQVGRGHGVVVDEKGRFAVAYYSADDRLRLARRPHDVAAFAVQSLGVLEKRDLDGWARGSIRASADLLALADGTIVVAYPHDVATDARLRIAIVRPGVDRAQIITDDRGRTVMLDGLTPRLIARSDGLIDVLTHDRLEGVLWRRELDVARGVFTETRERLVDMEGVAVSAASPRGYVMLARVPGEGGGVFLYVVEGPSDARERRRIRLGAGNGQTDSWLDVAVRPDGRPAAVWFDAATGSLMLYAP